MVLTLQKGEKLSVAFYIGGNLVLQRNDIGKRSEPNGNSEVNSGDDDGG